MVAIQLDLLPLLQEEYCLLGWQLGAGMPLGLASKSPRLWL